MDTFCDLLNGQDRSRRSPRGAHGAHEAQEGPSVRAQRAPRGPERDPRGPQAGPRWRSKCSFSGLAKNNTFCSILHGQEGSRRGSRVAPGGPKRASRRTPREPRKAPREVQDGLKRSQIDARSAHFQLSRKNTPTERPHMRIFSVRMRTIIIGDDK